MQRRCWPSQPLKLQCANYLLSGKGHRRVENREKKMKGSVDNKTGDFKKHSKCQGEWKGPLEKKTVQGAMFCWLCDGKVFSLHAPFPSPKAPFSSFTQSCIFLGWVWSSLRKVNKSFFSEAMWCIEEITSKKASRIQDKPARHLKKKKKWSWDGWALNFHKMHKWHFKTISLDF